MILKQTLTQRARHLAPRSNSPFADFRFVGIFKPAPDRVESKESSDANKDESGNNQVNCKIARKALPRKPCNSHSDREKEAKRPEAQTDSRER